MAVITHDEVRRGLGLHALPGDAIRTINELLIPNAVADLEEHLGKVIEPIVVTDERHVRDHWEWGSINLRRRPVRSIEAVRWNGQTLVADSDFTSQSWGVGWLITPTSLSWPVTIDVDYTAGYLLTDRRWPAIRACLMSRLKREASEILASGAATDSMIGFDSLSVEGYSVSRTTTESQSAADPGAHGHFLSAELAAVDRFRRRLVC